MSTEAQDNVSDPSNSTGMVEETSEESGNTLPKENQGDHMLLDNLEQ